MPIRLLNANLLIAAVIGGVLAYRAGKERQQLLNERRRLETKVGSLPIEDPSKVRQTAVRGSLLRECAFVKTAKEY